MKTKLLITLLVIALVASVAFGVVACTPKDDGGDKNNDNKNTVILQTLPDMVDYGADAKYYNNGTTGYSNGKVIEWTGKLETKQAEEREKWVESQNAVDWPSEVKDMKEFYVTFGNYAESIDSEGEEEIQSAIGYFAPVYNEVGTQTGTEWVDDEDASTIQRLFSYSTAAQFIKRMDSARVDEDKTDALIKYITRNDSAYVAEDEKRSKDDYEFKVGYASALEDFDQLNELQTIYDDFTEYDMDESYPAPRFEDENDVQDYINRKKRKIYGEIFTIFQDKADQFARCAIQLVGYGIEIIDDVMIPAYNHQKAQDDTKLTYNCTETEISFEDYVRYEMFDHETLSYLLAFMDPQITDFNMAENVYDATKKSKMMSLYGYYYQYQKRDYEVFDDKKTVNNKRIGTVTEYEDFLELNHKSYFDSTDEVLRYRDYDSRQYAKAYRYSYACYQKYYKAQLDFQSIQEAKDLEVYVGGAGAIGNSIVNGEYGTAKTNGIGVARAGITYSGEMQKACTNGLESTLKLSDVNYEYSSVDNNVLRLNTTSMGWNGLTETEQAEFKNKINKVYYEVAQLQSQHYAMTHKTITDIDLSNALIYQIYSYSADSIRSIQSTKKDEITYYLAIDRFLSVVPNTYEEIRRGDLSVSEYVKDTFAELEEDAGRNDAKFINVDQNYKNDAQAQETSARNHTWTTKGNMKGVKDNIKETIDTDFDAYHASPAAANKSVDVYFEDVLIRKIYSCGADLDEACLDGTSHANCTDEYDSNWSLSRLVSAHEEVIRYMAGQTIVTFQKINQEQFKTPTMFHKDITSMPNGTILFSSDSARLNTASEKYYTMTCAPSDDVTLASDDVIGVACTTVKEGAYPTVGTSSQYWDYVPVYEQNNFTSHWTTPGKVDTGKIVVTVDNVKYTYTFVGWYVDQNYKYGVLLDEEYNYDIMLYPGYMVEIEK